MSFLGNKHHKTDIYKADYDEFISLPDGTTPVALGSGVIDKIVGEGGTAVVYRIWNEQLNTYRAVKLMKPSASHDTRERFAQEIKIMGQLSHPNIINVHSVGNWHGLPYIEMDIIDGFSLDQLIAEMGAFPLSVTLAIAICTARALDYTHTHHYKIDSIEYEGLLHRDLKPANIMLPKNETVRLTDFGIASLSTVGTTATSQQGMVTGSMQYLAPEQLEADEVDQRSDIYSFGCVLYEMLTGEKVFPERHIAKLVRLRVQNEYKALRKWNLKIPTSLENFVEACLNSSPNQRPRSMRQVLTFLEDIYRKVEQQRPEQVIRSFLKGEVVASKHISRRVDRSLHWGRNFLTTVPGFITAVGIVALFSLLTVTSLYHLGVIGPASPTLSEISVVGANGSRRAQEVRPIPELERYMEIYDTRDTSAVLEKLDSDGKYELLSKIIDALPVQTRSRKAIRIRKHRSVVALNQESFSYYSNTHISDGEFFYDKGRFFYDEGLYQRAIWLLRSAATTPPLLVNTMELQRQVRYLTALCETRLAEENPSQTTIETAYNSWIAVAEDWKEQSYHPNYQYALDEISRLKRKL